MPNLCVRWGGKKLNVEANVNDTPLTLKAQLFGLTGVPPDRQKIIIKGKSLSDHSWNGIKVEEGATIMMMGSAEPFSNDEPSQCDGQKQSVVVAKVEEKAALVLPVGLVNLGNTCYMNASLQCFKMIPELSVALKEFNTSSNTNIRPQLKAVINNVKKLYESMDKGSGSEPSSAQTPFFMLTALHSAFPQFASQDERGRYQQQDANECFSEVLTVLAGETTFLPPQEQKDSSEDQKKQQQIKLRRLLEVEFEATVKCLENADEPVETVKESHIQLSCFLNQEVRYLQSGIKSKLIEEIEKNSPTLGKNARYEKKALISRLPAYLSIQLVRFFYKEKDKINAKILKDVKFPIYLDVFDLVTPALQTKLRPTRDAFKEYEDAMLEQQRKSKIAIVPEENKPDGQDGEKIPVEYHPTGFFDDPGSNCSGYYELKALITHKGRSSDSGHYVAWVRVSDGSDSAENKQDQSKWAMCDDNDVYLVSEEDILRLSGGGDYHCAYVLLYGPRKLPKLKL